MFASKRTCPRRVTTGPSLVERLEGRQLLSASYGTNLIQNPGAEADVGDFYNIVKPAGWTSVGKSGIRTYFTGLLRGSVPPNHGSNFFYGGKSTMQDSSLSQSIDLSALGTDIDAGRVTFSLAGWLGADVREQDTATLSVTFEDGSHKALGNKTSVGPTSGFPNPGLFEGSAKGTIPAGARAAKVQLLFGHAFGFDNDGSADNLSLVLAKQSAPTTGSVSGRVFNDANGNGAANAGEGGLAGVRVYTDQNGNGKRDSGELFGVTDGQGNYAINGLKPGPTSLRVEPPTTFRQTSPVSGPVSATVSAGKVLAGKNFGLSQTVVLGGTVFNDANGNKTKDAGEAGLANVVLYLDFNNNGQPDEFELRTTTDAQGNYRFVLPFGTYAVRQVTPAQYAQTSGPAAKTLAKGAVSLANVFADRHI